MKIGLLSYHRNYNYGWNLQCYALMTVLKSMEHEVILIDKMKFSNKSLLKRLKNICAHMLHLNRGRSYEDVQIERGVRIEPFSKITFSLGRAALKIRKDIENYHTLML